MSNEYFEALVPLISRQLAYNFKEYIKVSKERNNKHVTRMRVRDV